jgi:hypothetical protein
MALFILSLLHLTSLPLPPGLKSVCGALLHVPDSCGCEINVYLLGHKCGFMDEGLRDRKNKTYQVRQERSRSPNNSLTLLLPY